MTPHPVSLAELGLAYAASLGLAVLLDLMRVLGFTVAIGPASGDAVRLDRLNLSAVILLYLLDATGLAFFAAWPALALRQIGVAAIAGLAYGFCSRAGFALTRQPPNLRAALRPAELLPRLASAGIAASGAYGLARVLA